MITTNTYQVDLAEQLCVQLVVADAVFVEEVGDDVGEAIDARAKLRKGDHISLDGGGGLTHLAGSDAAHDAQGIPRCDTSQEAETGLPHRSQALPGVATTPCEAIEHEWAVCSARIVSNSALAKT